jgi:hypothetical protein
LQLKLRNARAEYDLGGEHHPLTDYRVSNGKSPVRVIPDRQEWRSKFKSITAGRRATCTRVLTMASFGFATPLPQITQATRWWDQSVWQAKALQARYLLSVVPS